MSTATPQDDGTTAIQLRDFALEDEDFEGLRRLVRDVTGINLSIAKRELVYARLARRLRALRLRSFAEYRSVLSRDDGTELAHFCNAITTNLTSFFRESHHFDYLGAHVARLAAASPEGLRLRLWSAGCSSGEEPYSMAMSIMEALPQTYRCDLRILATDIDTEVLAQARRGLYPAERVRAVSPARLARFFTAVPASDGGAWQVRPELARLITFKQLNLVHPLPMRGPLDAVFCRNVIIYFDKTTQRELFRRIAPLQRPGDLLFLGHSESLYKVSDAWQPEGRTVYRRS